MFLTKCAACAADCTTSIKACGRCQTVYCSAQCQKTHWESGHDKLCKMIKKKGGAEQLYADKQYKASIKVAVDKCAADARSRRPRRVGPGPIRRALPPGAANSARPQSAAKGARA